MNNKSSNNQLKKSINPVPITENLPQVEEIGFQMQEEIDRLEEMILDNPRIAFTGRTLVDEDKLINQLDLIRINIPDTLEQALEILQQKERIINEAQEYAKKVIENAQQKAKKILDETGIVQQAEAQASQIRRQIQEECDNLQRKTIQEAEQVKRKVQQDVTRMRQQAIAESEDIQNEADDYADAALSRLEKQLSEMLKIVHNGRQQLNQSPSNIPSKKIENPPMINPAPSNLNTNKKAS